MKTRRDALMVLAIAFVLGGPGACTLDGGPDPDGEMLSALGLLAPSQVTDSIDADSDPRDWREFSHFEAAEVTATYHIGDPSQAHDVRGVIEVYDASGLKLADQPVSPSARSYALRFPAEPGQKYFLLFHARQGTARYLLDCQVAPLDPCGGCEESEICEEGRCVPAGCQPACGPGQECKAGRCADIDCPRGELLDKRAGLCRPDACYRHACKEGERCRVKRGKPGCVRVSRRDACDPPCGDGQLCKAGVCKEAPAAPAAPVAIKARIMNYWVEDGKVVMLLNRGKEHGVRQGMTGALSGGGSVTVTEVYPYQCRARTSLGKDQMSGKKSVTLK